MKNFKKVLALVLAFAMVLSTMTAFAAEGTKYEAEGDVLYALGLLAGYSTTEKELGLEDDLSREAAMKLIVDMMGWEVDMDATSDFEDVAAWAQPYVAVAVEKGVTNGISADAFGGSSVSTMHQLVTWYLRALGYDTQEAWDNAATLAIELALVDPAELVSFDGEVKRDALAGVAYKALSVTKVGSTSTLVESLVASGKVSEDKASEYSLIVVEPEVFEVASVEPLNLAQTVVVFSQEVDSDSVKKDLFSVGGKTTNKVTVLEDGMAVLVDHEAVSNQADHTVKVKDVKNEADEKVVKYEEEVNYKDTIAPEVVDVEVVGERTIRVMFSEAMKYPVDKDAFKVTKESGAKVFVKTATINTDDYTCIDIELVSSMKDDENYTLEVNTKAQDWVGLGAIYKTEFTFVPNDDELEVVGFEDAKQESITLIFNKDIVENGSITSNLSKIYHTNSKNVAVNATASGTKLELSFKQGTTENLLPKGTAYIYIEKEVLKDLWGNKNADIKAVIAVEEDTTAPIVKEIEQNDTSKKEIKVVFEDTDLKEAKKENFVILDEDGEEVEMNNPSYTTGNDYVIVKAKDDLAGMYTVIVKELKDTEGNEMEEYEGEVEMVDKDAPAYPTGSAVTLRTVGDDYIVTIRFEKEMATEGDYAVTDLERYQFVTVSGATSKITEAKDIDEITLDVKEDGKVVELSWPTKEYTITTATTLNMSRVADVSGNVTSALSLAGIAINAVGNVTIDKVEAIDTNTLKVYLTEKLDDFAWEDFVAEYTTGSGAGVTTKAIEFSSSETEEKDGKTVLVFDLEYETDYAAVYGNGAVVIRTVATGSATEYGERIQSGLTVTAADKINPEFDGDSVVVTRANVYLATATTTTTQIVAIDLKEDVTVAATGFAVSDIKLINDDGDVLVYGTDYVLLGDAAYAAYAADSSKTAYVLNNSASNGVAFVLLKEYEGTLTVKVEGANFVQDAAGNTIADFEKDIELIKY